MLDFLNHAILYRKSNESKMGWGKDCVLINEGQGISKW